MQHVKSNLAETTAYSRIAKGSQFSLRYFIPTPAWSGQIP
jgi:hypothetical protein